MRISRVAVDTRWRRRGVATSLYQTMRKYALGEYTFLSSSFAFQSSSLPFWQSLGALPVALGMRLDKASGARSMLVVDSIDASMHSAQCKLALQLAGNLRYWCPRFFPEMADSDIHRLQGFSDSYESSAGESTSTAGEFDLVTLQRFANGELDASLALPALARVLAPWPANSTPVLEREPPTAQLLGILQACVAIAPDWGALANELGCSGLRAVQRALREAVREWLESFSKSLQSGRAQQD
ncbi:MAG: hypothetical protein HKO07_02815 [Pseudomonadales bacterium]|nr:hypothetical protein [Pseudomonadales bacterium]